MTKIEVSNCSDCPFYSYLEDSILCNVSGIVRKSIEREQLFLKCPLKKDPIQVSILISIPSNQSTLF